MILSKELSMCKNSYLALVIASIASCGGGSGDGDSPSVVVPQTIRESNLLGNWQRTSGCVLNVSGQNEFRRNFDEYRSDSTFSDIFEIYSDSECTLPKHTGTFEGIFEGGTIVNELGSGSILTLDKNYETALLVIHSQESVDAFNSLGATCPTSTFVKDVTYDLTPCGESTINGRLLPAIIYQVYQISNNILSMSTATFDPAVRPSLPDFYTLTRPELMAQIVMQPELSGANSNIGFLQPSISGFENSAGINVYLY